MNDTAHLLDSQQQHEGDVRSKSGEEMRERLRRAADAATTWDVVHRPMPASVFPARVRTAQRALQSLQKQLAAMPDLSAKETGSSGSAESAAIFELRENPRMLRSAVSAMLAGLRAASKLPRVVTGNKDKPQDEPRALTASRWYLDAMDGEFSSSTFRIFIEELQRHEPLAVDELWMLPLFLNFALMESLLKEAQALLDARGGTAEASIPVWVTSIRAVGHADWVALVEPLIAFEAKLSRDPAGAYSNMDFDSRESYRKRVAYIAHRSDKSESEVAQAAFDLAQEGGLQPASDPRLRLRRSHVGYYLLDDGFTQLQARVGFHPSHLHRIRAFLRAHADDFYITGIQCITLFFLAAAIVPLLPRHPVLGCLAVAVLLALPASQGAVDLINNMVIAIFEPVSLAKLDFSSGIPAECTTIVAVPTLLLNANQVRDLIAELELRFLVNRDPNLHFMLLTDLPDSVTKPRDNDFDPLVELAVQLIGDLNRKYNSATNGFFLLLHRHRIFNKREGVWMGWERKRGKLLDVNKLLAGEYDAFPIKAGNLEVLSRVRYILTLDSDTQLPRGAASRMVGAIAHPLNQAIVDPQLRIVTSGYGILQPRVGITVQSASRSRLASIHSGQSGFDVYARAISDPYQDLYGEGIFTGKGIYEVKTFHEVLDRRFPRNSLLSHDLIEGAYARAGLVTDVEVIDDYPSHYSAYTRRKHRWVRGDWQIAQWMFGRVPEESGHMAPNPISSVSRWKIFDNLRRSLVEPITFLLFVAGWLGLPGGPIYWTAVSLALLIIPSVVQFCFGMTQAVFSEAKGRVREVFSSSGQALLMVLLNLVYLPHQALLALDAIVRALVRRFITGERLLEWETAAQAESKSARRTPVDLYLALTPFLTVGLAALIYVLHAREKESLIAEPVLLLWALSPFVTAWLNAPPREQNGRIAQKDEMYLRTHALRIWRYFYQFSSERHHYLIPDNVEEEGLYEAARVSPTNLGLLLNARQAACEFGSLTAPEFALLTSQTLATIARMDKHRGHLFNWYNTETLEPLGSREISSVDSGNYVASLLMLRAGVSELIRQPLLPLQLFACLRVHWEYLASSKYLTPPLKELSLPAQNSAVADWIVWLIATEPVLAEAIPAANEEDDKAWWIVETHRRAAAILTLVREYMPWLLPDYASLCDLPQLLIMPAVEALSIDTAVAYSEGLYASLDDTSGEMPSDSPLDVAGQKLRVLLPSATRNLRALAADLRSIEQTAAELADATDFKFLVHPERRLLSIGYAVDSQTLSNSCYDMLASEARIATFLAITRDDLAQKSWFNLGREHTIARGQFLLLSWTGTMFEYLMPALWMRSYPDTLISRTLDACVHVQRHFAQIKHIPWGISEAGFAATDDGGHYKYHAFGIPEIALKRDAKAGPVVSPYATYLALGIDAVESLQNLRRMESAGWTGSFGLYESVDYQASLATPTVVREWMAHHQGMALLAILNLLRDNVAQRWFHASPVVQANEILLHERPANRHAFRREV